ncbi:Breast cancer metastasis-suppressor 1-like protein-A [Larimichthys crocea]|uniref:Uncharacterized protein n=1 Tax=Larimichthys crocea TaxID=215358 RepID=A0ACD3RPF4_LARCR|nr:Breast cancer metastasis-suppressor 1-like protein-A [Larimichthys crocea]
MPVHRDREKKESTAEEMEVEEHEQEATSSEEEDSDTSSVSEDGDSSEMDEEDCERRRTECLDEMSNLEKQFTDLKDQLYRERLSQVNSKLTEGGGRPGSRISGASGGTAGEHAGPHQGGRLWLRWVPTEGRLTLTALCSHSDQTEPDPFSTAETHTHTHTVTHQETLKDLKHMHDACRHLYMTHNNYTSQLTATPVGKLPLMLASTHNKDLRVCNPFKGQTGTGLPLFPLTHSQHFQSELGY